MCGGDQAPTGGSRREPFRSMDVSRFLFFLKTRSLQDFFFDYARGAPIALPVEQREKTRRQMHRKAVVIAVSGTLVLSIVLCTLLFAVGILQRLFLPADDPQALPPETARGMLIIVLGLPAGVGLFGYLASLLFNRPRGYHDVRGLPPLHPLRFVATEEGLAIHDAQGDCLSGPWSQWRVGNVAYIRIKTQTFATGAHLHLGEESRFLDLSRLPRSTKVHRAITQQLLRHARPEGGESAKLPERTGG